MVVITVLVDVAERVSKAVTMDVVVLGLDIATVLGGITKVEEAAEVNVAASTVLAVTVVAGNTVVSRNVDEAGRNPAQGATGSFDTLLSSLGLFVCTLSSVISSRKQ